MSININLLTAEQKLGLLAALESSIFRGVGYVSYNGDQVKYRSLAEMLLLRKTLMGMLGLSDPTPAPKRGAWARRIKVRE